MLTCKQITELVTDYAEGHLRLLDRLRFKLHLGTCLHCRAYVRQLEITARALGKLPEPEIPPELGDELQRRFEDWRMRSKPAFPMSARAQEARPRALSVLAVLAALVLVVVLAQHRSRSPLDWAVASALAASAVALAAVASRLSLGVVAAGVSAAFVAAFVSGGDGPLALSTGLHCLGTEVASAAAVVVATWLAIRRGQASRARYGLAAAAVAGALAGDAALQITCGVRTALPHLLVFHAGGVLVAAGALLTLRSRLLPAQPRS